MKIVISIDLGELSEPDLREKVVNTFHEIEAEASELEAALKRKHKLDAKVTAELIFP